MPEHNPKLAVNNSGDNGHPEKHVEEEDTEIYSLELKFVHSWLLLAPESMYCQTDRVDNFGV